MLTAIAPNAGLLYGPFGSAKTSQIKFLAQYVYKKYGKKTRLISADGGGWGPIQAYVNHKIIQPVSITGVPNPGEYLKFLLEGHWPFDANGKMIDKFGSVASQPTSKTWDEIGAYAIEGIYSISNLLMGHHSSNNSLKGMAGGAMSKDQQTSQIVDGTDVWTQPGLGFYNYIFQKMAKYATQSSALPVNKVLWTSLMHKYQEKDKQQIVTVDGPYGPAIVGKQGILVIPQWFGDGVIHLDSVNTGIEAETRGDRATNQTKVGVVQKLHRAYFRTHTHPKDGLQIPALLRLDPAVDKEFPDYKDFTAEEGILGWYYTKKDELTAKAEELALADLGIKL